MRIVGGRYRGKKLNTPIHSGTRPTSDRTRETIFNILLHNPSLGPRVILDKAVLDVFAGTGALGLEAYSRGAKSVAFIENDPKTLQVLKENVKSFDLLSSCILSQDVLHLGKTKSSYDLVFLDPPYHKGLVPLAVDQLMIGGWLSEQAVVVIEVAKDETIKIPDSLVFITERVSGAAKILFLKLIRS